MKLTHLQTGSGEFGEFDPKQYRRFLDAEGRVEITWSDPVYDSAPFEESDGMIEHRQTGTVVGPMPKE